MRMGLQIRRCYPSKYGNHFDTLLALVQACEGAGLDSVWMPDHFMFEDEPVMESFVVLSAIAAATRRIRMGQLVTGIPYRNPALLVKMCTTLDVVSHGRSIVGLGAAWHEPEFTAYGWSFPSVSERMARLEEGVQIVDLMLRQSPATFSGKYYSIQEAYNEPRPVQKPRPPILIGGDGERVTLKLVAQYADYCNVFGDPATVAHKYAVLRKHCDAVSRPFDEITLSNHSGILIAQNEAELAARQKQYPDFGGIQGTPDVVLAQLKEYAAVGSQYITFHIPKADDIADIHLLGEAVLPHLANL